MQGNRPPTLTQSEAYELAKAAFSALADEPTFDLVQGSTTDEGDTRLDIKVRRKGAVLAAPYVFIVTPSRKIRAFADGGAARLERVTSPPEVELERLDAAGAVLRCKDELKGIVPNLHAIFPRYAFSSPANGRWEVLTGLITRPDTGLNQYALEVSPDGRVYSLTRVGTAW